MLEDTLRRTLGNGERERAAEVADAVLAKLSRWWALAADPGPFCPRDPVVDVALLAGGLGDVVGGRLIEERSCLPIGRVADEKHLDAVCGGRQWADQAVRQWEQAG